MRHLKSLKTITLNKFIILVPAVIGIILLIVLLIVGFNLHQKTNRNVFLEKKLNEVSDQLDNLKNQDQYKTNQKLKANIKNIENSYKISIDLYQRILDLKAQNQNTKTLDTEFADSLNYLSQLNYSSGSASLKILALDIEKKEASIVPPPVTVSSIQNVPVNNTAPGSGFSQQSVSVDGVNFIVDIIAADLNSTKVIVDTASEADCSNNCPTLPLSDYISRSGAFAGINGSYFCPAEYPSCAGKTGSFDLLVMNKNKVYFNSSNNVYSTNPAVIFQNGSMRFVSQALQWGRDTGVDSVLSNYPLLVSGGQVVYSGGGDPKFAPKGPRGFIANKGNIAYIGVVLGASMEDAAKVLKTLGMDNAMNLDEGGSTALWSGGYKMGPGRNIPNAILFVRK